MAINVWTPHGKSKNEQVADDAMSLAQLLGRSQNIGQQGQIDAQQQQVKGQQGLADIAAQGEQARQTQASGTEQKKALQQSEIGNVKDLRSFLGPKNAYKVGDTSIAPKEESPMVDMRREKQVEDKTEHLSKRYENHGDFLSSLNEIEGLTASKDAQGNKIGGGIITNPEAQLKSTGKMLSAVPTSMIGLAEMVGGAPKGSAEERKALDRLKLNYQKSMTGLRTTDATRQAENAAMGYIASGDPSLVAKGVRSLARNVRNAIRATKAGYTAEVQDRVHSSMGDPEDALRNIAEDYPEHMQAVAPAGGIDRSQATGAAPMSFEEFKAMRRQGK